jgi:geranylgeranyl reductase family protein
VSTAHDVLVAGGGPAGAATAAYCARAGLRVLLVDRARFPRPKACAEYLSPEAARDLEALGVLAAVERAGGARLTGFRLVSDDGHEAVGRFAGTAPSFVPYRPFGFALPRTVLDPIVLDAARAAGAEVREATTLDDLVLDRGRVTGGVLRSAQGKNVVRASAIVGADGLNSRVARRLGLVRAGRPRRLGLVAHLAGVQGTSDVGEMFAGRGWYVGVAPIGGGLVNVAMVVPLSDGAAMAGDVEGFFLARLRTLPELDRRIAGARIARRVLVAGPFARRARRVIADGALLVGDAADFFDPFTGEGVFAALRGGRLAADALVAALAAGAATRAALAPYVAARRRQFAGKWVLERVVGLGAVHPRLMRRFTSRLAGHPAVTDLWVGAAGDSVPVRALFSPRRLAALV